MAKKNRKSQSKALKRHLTEILSGSKPVEGSAELLRGMGYEPSDDLAALTALTAAVSAQQVTEALLETAPEALLDATARALGERVAVENLKTLSGAQKKSVRKAALAALHRLEARGVDVSREESPAPILHLGAGEPRAIITAIDGSGQRLMYVHLNADSTIHVILLGEEGHFDLDLREGSMGTMERIVVDFTAQTGLPHVEIPLGYAVLTLQRGAALAKANGRPPSLDASQLIRELARHAPPQDAFPEELKSVEANTNDAQSEEVTSMMMSPAVQHWALEKDILDRGLAIVGESRSDLIISEEAQADRQKQTIRAAVTACFTDEVSATYAQRLQETATFFFLNSEPDLAIAAARAATGLRDPDVPAGATPFGRSFFMLSTMKTMEQMGLPTFPSGASDLAPETATFHEDEPLIIPG